jgi:multimeric flavodoxin WrbA
MDTQPTFEGIRALFLNTSLSKDGKKSHTMKLINRAAGIMREQKVDVEVLHLLDYQIAFGMEKDLKTKGWPYDDWPAIQQKVMDADILVIGTPIWLGEKSSVATLAIERLYAYSGDRNPKGQYLYYGKAGGAIVTGNEDGIKHCSRDILYALQHIGYMIPPQADCGWIGEAGPGPSYGDKVEGSDTPVGYDNDFTNRNTTFMAWNLMHAARMLREQGGWPSHGNVADDWQHVTNAAHQNPEYH